MSEAVVLTKREPQTSLKLLIIEDSTDLSTLWVRLFQMKGHECVTRSCGKEAIQILESGEEFDLVVSDYFLPDMTGLAILDQVRKYRASLPFLFVTGARDHGIIDQIRKRAFTDHLSKPVRFQELEERTRAFTTLIKKRQLETH